MAKPGAEFRDPYIDPETGIMRNRLGISDRKTLERVEAELTVFRAAELAARPVEGRFDLAHLQALHQRLFGDIYEWAGNIRTVEIAKGDTQFGPRASIESYAAQVARKLARENHLRGLDPDRFSRRAAYYLGEINAVHPFREGNGRAQREFIGQLAHQAGYHIRWSGMRREDMIRASIEAWRSEPVLLTKMIRENLADRDLEHLVRGEPSQTSGRIVGPLAAPAGKSDAGLEALFAAADARAAEILASPEQLAFLAKTAADDRAEAVRPPGRSPASPDQARKPDRGDEPDLS